MEVAEKGIGVVEEGGGKRWEEGKEGEEKR